MFCYTNAFTGPLPDFSALKDLQVLSLSLNKLTGPVPASLLGLLWLKVVNLTSNLFHGPMSVFAHWVEVDNAPGCNNFCLPSLGDCDPRMELLLSVVGLMEYHPNFAKSWIGQ